MLVPPNRFINTEKPVMQFFEDGEWLRIEVQGQNPRYMRKAPTQNMLRQIGLHSVSEKSDIIL